MSEPSPKRLQLAQRFMASIGRSDVGGAIRLLSSSAMYRVGGAQCYWPPLPLAGTAPCRVVERRTVDG